MALLEAALAELTKERRFGSGKGGQTTDAPGPLQVCPLMSYQCSIPGCRALALVDSSVHRQSG